MVVVVGIAVVSLVKRGWATPLSSCGASPPFLSGWTSTCGRDALFFLRLDFLSDAGTPDVPISCDGGSGDGGCCC